MKERESVCLYAAVTGHNLTFLFELGLSEREWKRAGKKDEDDKQHACLYTGLFLCFNVATQIYVQVSYLFPQR